MRVGFGDARAKGRRACRTRHTRNIDIVLESDRYAVEWTERPAGDPTPAALLSMLQRAVIGHRDVTMKRRVIPGDARQVSLGRADRVELPSPIRRGEGCNAEFARIAHAASALALVDKTDWLLPGFD